MRFSVRLLLIAVLAWGSAAFAQGTVGIDPVAKRFSAKPGQTITQTLNIYNPNDTKTKLKVTAYLSDFSYDEIGQITYAKPGTFPESASRWVTVSPTEIELGGQESKQVRYTVQVPADAKPGSHWVMLMFEGTDPAAVKEKVLATFRLRVAHTIFVNVEPIKTDGEISGIYDKAPKNEKDYFEFAIQYNNTGNAAVGVKGRVEIRNERGDLVATLPVDLTVSLPQRNTLLKTAFTGPFKKGTYNALVVLSDGSKTRDIVGEHPFTLPFDLVQSTPAAAPAQPAATQGGKP